jgi:hypothetical protein
MKQPRIAAEKSRSNIAQGILDAAANATASVESPIVQASIIPRTIPSAFEKRVAAIIKEMVI